MENRETAPKEERETILSYDALTGKWHFYSNEPKHINKWSRFIQDIDQQAQNKYGNLTVLEGDISGASVTLYKKKKLTDQQREQAKERMLKLNQQRKEKDN